MDPPQLLTPEQERTFTPRIVIIILLFLHAWIYTRYDRNIGSYALAGLMAVVVTNMLTTSVDGLLIAQDVGDEQKIPQILDTFIAVVLACLYIWFVLIWMGLLSAPFGGRFGFGRRGCGRNLYE